MLRAAVVGLGYWGPNLARNFASSARAELASLCDRDPDRLEELGRRYPAARRSPSAGEVLKADDVDVVAIATPVDTHYPLVRDALLADKHVLVEKPFTPDVGQARELVQLADERGCLLMVDHVFLYSPAVRKLRQLVESGHLGELQFIDSVRINLGLVQHDVNVIWDLAPHDLSIMDHLIGRAPETVVAVGACHSTDLSSVAYLHLDYGDDLLASVHVNWLSPVKIRHMLIGGSGHSVLYNDLDPSEPVKVYDRGIDVDLDPEGRRDVLVSYRSGDVVSPRVPRDEPLALMVDHVVDCIEDGASCISGADQGLRLVRILEAADRSMTKGGVTVEV